MQRRPETSATGKFSSVMIPDDANILSAVKKCYNRKSCFRASTDAKNVSNCGFCAFIHCPTKAIQQETRSCLTRFERQDNKKRKAIQQELVGNPYCFARRRFRRMVGRGIEKRHKSMIVNTLHQSNEKRPKLPKEWASEKAARSFGSFGQLRMQISSTYPQK